jgi:hypothetical protein
MTDARAREHQPTVPASREEAAKALIGVPMAAITVASMTAMTKTMANQPASRADLVTPFLEKLPAANLYMTMANAIDGALALAPELAPRNEALRAAAQGVAALLAEAAADTTPGNAMEALARLSGPLQLAATPLFEAALVLDPNLRQPQKPQD